MHQLFRLLRLSARLQGPVTPSYAALALALGLLAAGLVLTPGGLSNAAKYVVMLVTLAGLARFGDSPTWHLAWRAGAGLLVLGLGLELLT